jgi:hypothetical protein
MALVQVRLEGPHLTTDWGVIEHADPHPHRGQVGSLMLTTPNYVRDLISNGPSKFHNNAVHSIRIDGRRMYARIDYYGKHWTWELFPAYFADNQGPPIIVGMWPD